MPDLETPTLLSRNPFQSLKICVTEVKDILDQSSIIPLIYICCWLSFIKRFGNVCSQSFCKYENIVICVCTAYRSIIAQIICSTFFCKRKKLLIIFVSLTFHFKCFIEYETDFTPKGLIKYFVFLSPFSIHFAFDLIWIPLV